MQSLYRRSKLWFSLAWIIVYVVGTSIADNLSRLLGVEKSLSLPFLLFLSAAAIGWMHRNQLSAHFGLRAPAAPASRFLFYLPLVLLASANFWFGVQINMPLGETLLYAGSMICVGFLEELIFRGFLFSAMAEDNPRTAAAVSSLTFGIGHLVNLVNGSGAELIPNLCQVISAIAFGYLFVIIAHRGRSLWPCILMHAAINVSSAFANQAAFTDAVNIAVSAALFVLAFLYALLLRRTLPPPQEE